MANDQPCPRGPAVGSHSRNDCFAVAIRYRNHVVIEINVPQPERGQGDAITVQRVMDRGGPHYAVGMRRFYFAVPLAIWSFGALWLSLGGVALCIAFYLMDCPR